MNDDNKDNRPHWVRPMPQLSAAEEAGVRVEPREHASEGEPAFHAAGKASYQADEFGADGANHAASRGGKAIADNCYHGVSFIGHYGLVAFEWFAGLIFKRRSGWARSINYGTGIGLVLLIALSVFYYSMGWRALSVSFLKPQIEAALAANFGGADVEIDDVLLQRDGERGGLYLRLTNMSIRSQSKEPIAASPETAIGIRFLPLLIGSVQPDSLSLIGPEIHLVRNEEGAWTLWRQARGVKPEADGIASLIEEGRVTTAAAPQTQLGDVVEEALAKVHGRLQNSFNLTDIGVLKARVVLHPGPNEPGDVWYVPSFTVQYDSTGEKQLIGRGVIQHENSPGAGVWVSLTHRQGDAFLDIKSQLENMVPSELSSLVPVLGSLKPLQIGVSGDMEARLHLREGLVSGKVSVSLAEGRIGLLGTEGPGFDITRGAFDFVMEGDSKHIEMKRGDLIFPSGQISLTGDIWRDSTGKGPGDWRFQLASNQGEIVSDVDGKRYAIEGFGFSGLLFKVDAPILIEELRARVGPSTFIVAHDNSKGYPAVLRGRLANVPLGLIKSTWPKGFHEDSRQWVMANVTAGLIRDGVFALGGVAEEEGLVKKVASKKASKLPMLHLRLTDLTYKVFDDPLVISAPKAEIKVQGHSFTASMEKGFSDLSEGGQITFDDGQLVIANYQPKIPAGVIAFTLGSKAPTVLKLLKRKPFEHRSLMSETAENIDGEISGRVEISLPITQEVTQEQISVEGKLSLTNGKADIGKFNFSDGVVNFLLGPNYVEAKGTTLINGVSSELEWRRQLVTDADYKAPPFYIRGRFDEADRNQLGMEVNHIVSGALPMEVALQEGAGDKFDIAVSADLTKTVMKGQTLGWRKEAGVPASLDFKILPQQNGEVVLDEFRIEGQELTARGRIELDADGKVKSFLFPKISYQVVSNITLKGERGAKDIWDVMATGQTYDGRGILRSLLRTGQIGGGAPRQAKGGMNLIAKFDTVIGWQQSQLSNFQINMKRRGEEMTNFAVDGRLRNGGLLKARQVSSGGEDPVILVETSDAGEALRFVGFYPNMLGGTGQLTVRYNVKKRQLASKTGQLMITRFSIASDPVVKEVLANVAQGKKAKQVGGQDIIPFTRLVAPFSIGHEQFILHDSYVSGELLGATMRGSLDFQNERVRLGGTYIPLYGLNAAVGAVPVLGDILVGRQGEGMLGITFGIYGKLSKPEVLVNPMSLVAPGVFRQIFEFEQGKQQIRARPDAPAKKKIKLDSSASQPQRRKLESVGKVPETSASTAVRRNGE